MPANLPPQYFDAEKNFRAAKSPPEKIAALEDMLAIMPKHKGTDHLRAELRSRIAKLTQQLSKKSGTQRTSMMIDKEGAAQVAVIGLPNSGKSQLIAGITNASPIVAEYPLSTHSALPGMMDFKDIKIQLIDTPPLAPQTIQWWLPPMLRQADALLVMVDLSYDPLVQLGEIKGHLDMMRIAIDDSIANPEEDVVVWHKQAMIIANKLDADDNSHNYRLLLDNLGSKLPVVAISATQGIGLDELRLEIYRMLDIIRVYTKAPGQKADTSDPIVLPRGSTLLDAAATVHKDFAAKLKYARIWGSGKHDGIMARRDHILEDGDIIELHL
ncbi:MAG: TGS domain-containing protein [Dehalococcoidales bacterium]|nr:TGS domain-containing protein [Dehalococcoidales bacterium]